MLRAFISCFITAYKDTRCDFGWFIPQKRLMLREPLPLIAIKLSDLTVSLYKDKVPRGAGEGAAVLLFPLALSSR